MDTRQYLVKAAEIESMQGEQITHFLNPNAIRLNKSLGDAVGMSQMGVHMIFIEPEHDSTEFHKHLYEEESIYILSGSGRLTIENDIYQVGKGDFIGFPANKVAHALYNNGKETLVCLVTGQRLKHDVADYPNKAKRIYRHNGEAEVVKHQDISHPKIHTARKDK
ncbi:MAG: cupin domain-containing protein [Cocleimonas sp.]